MLTRRKAVTLALAASTPSLSLVTSTRAATADRKLEGLLSAVRYDEELNATIPEQASLRIVAQSGKAVVSGSDYTWHAAPDGGGVFEQADGGWIYVSNSELSRGRGGVGAVRFDSQANIIDAYSILTGTSENCAGGKTLWGTWLSCEENEDDGQVYECDPTGTEAAIVRPGLGSFNHEAAAIDPQTGYVYLTEDKERGCLYRFVPKQAGDLSSGSLEVAVAEGMRLAWVPVPDPSASSVSTRKQVDNAARFQGGEGIIYADDHVYFTTKEDNKVWILNVRTMMFRTIYDGSLYDNPILGEVDNVVMSPGGELMIAEDNGDMQIVLLGEGYRPIPVVTLHGQDESEVCGPDFSPDGTRLYFSSQRGVSGKLSGGLTYELTLPDNVTG